MKRAAYTRAEVIQRFADRVEHFSREYRATQARGEYANDSQITAAKGDLMFIRRKTNWRLALDSYPYNQIMRYDWREKEQTTNG